MMDFEHGAASKRFDLLNGDDGIEVGNWLLFSNGARRELGPFGVQIPAPTEPIKKCRAKVHYFETLLDDAVADFRHFRRYLMDWAKARRKDHLGPPPRDELKKLDSMKAEVARLTALVDKWKCKYRKLRPKTSNTREKLRAEQATMCDQFEKKVLDARI